MFTADNSRARLTVSQQQVLESKRRELFQPVDTLSCPDEHAETYMSK